MSPTVVILTKLPGCLPVKTRLEPLLGRPGAQRAYRDMLSSTLEIARCFDPVPTIAFSPPDARPQEALALAPPVRWLPVEGEEGGICLERAIAAVYRGSSILALGGDVPDLPIALVEQTLLGLEEHDAMFIPTDDGGFSALALRRPVKALASGFRFGGDNSLDSLRGYLRSRRLRVGTSAPWPDVDTPEQFQAWQRRRIQKQRKIIK